MSRWCSAAPKTTYRTESNRGSLAPHRKKRHAQTPGRGIAPASAPHRLRHWRRSRHHCSRRVRCHCRAWCACGRGGGARWRGCRGNHAVGVAARQCSAHAAHRYHDIHRARRVHPRRAAQRRAADDLDVRATRPADAHRCPCHEARTGEGDGGAAANAARGGGDGGEERFKGPDGAEGGGAGDAALVLAPDRSDARGGVADGGIAVGDGGGTGQQGNGLRGAAVAAQGAEQGLRGRRCC